MGYILIEPCLWLVGPSGGLEYSRSGFRWQPIKGIGTAKYAENSASETIYLQSIVYKKIPPTR